MIPSQGYHSFFQFRLGMVDPCISDILLGFSDFVISRLLPEEKQQRRPQDKVLITVILRKDYMGRSLARKILNERELQDHLKAFVNPAQAELQFVDLAKLSITEQLELVHRTDILVGFHGAGMTRTRLSSSTRSLSLSSLALALSFFLCLSFILQLLSASVQRQW